MNFSPMSLISIAPQLAAYLKMAVDYYAALRSQGKEVSLAMVTSYLDIQMAEWDPAIGKAKLLDPETRHAAARFLAGVAINLASA